MEAGIAIGTCSREKCSLKWVRLWICSLSLSISSCANTREFLRFVISDRLLFVESFVAALDCLVLQTKKLAEGRGFNKKRTIDIPISILANM
jgi:hypothetical protein